MLKYQLVTDFNVKVNNKIYNYLKIQQRKQTIEIIFYLIQILADYKR